MARVAPLHSFAFKRPARASLRHIGVPDGGDVLAVYIWWAKQRRFQANLDVGLQIEVASSVRSIFGTDEEREPILPVVRTAFEKKSAGYDLCGVGGQFD